MRHLRTIESPIVAALVLTFAAPQSVMCVTSRLEGCQDPAVIAKSLREIGTKDWSEISFTVLPKMWPSEIHALDCEDGKYCTSGWSQDRIINGECECCELFFFTEPGKNNETKQELDNIIIHYSGTEERAKRSPLGCHRQGHEAGALLEGLP